MGWRAVARVVCLILPLLLLAVFVSTFDPNVNRWPVTFTWLAAVLIWSFGIWWFDRPALSGRRDRKHLWFVVLLGVFAASWLPFYDNWRWAQAGDSFPWFWLPAAAAKHGLAKSILSVRGIWDLMTYTSVTVDNFLMFIVGPTFFWHRVSKFVISALALTAIYTFFSLILEFPWALVVVIVTAGTFEWEAMSRISFNHIDSFIFAYLALAAFTLILREPERRTRWLGLGVVGGLSMFFTQTAWAEVAACGLALAVWAVFHRRVAELLLCGASLLVASVPIWLQLPDLLRAATLQSRMLWDWAYLSMIFRAVLWLPAGRDLSMVEWSGAFASWPCGYFYFTGLFLAALSLLPGMRRRWRLPWAASGLLFLFLAEAVVMTLTNNMNPVPSPKRTYHLVPLQAFFGVLPFYAAAMALRRSVLVSRAVTVLAFLAAGAYTAVQASVFVCPELFNFGGNIFDGIVQMRQRFPDRKVLLYAPQANIKGDVEDPTTILNETYHVAQTVSVTPTIDARTVDLVCASNMILCDHALPQNRADLARAATGHQLRTVKVLAVPEMQCFECAAPRTGPG